MKTIVIWSSRTGNTKAVGRAIYEALSGDKEWAEAGRVKDFSPYDLVFVGFWAYRRGPDEMAAQVLKALAGKKVAVYGTCGAWPDSGAGKRYIESGAALLSEDNTYLGGFICQGRVHSFHTGHRFSDVAKVHPMTEERRLRLEEAEHHPDEADLAKAARWAREMERKARSDEA